MTCTCCASLLAALRPLLENAEVDALNEDDENLHLAIAAAHLAIRKATGK